MTVEKLTKQAARACAKYARDRLIDIDAERMPEEVREMIDCEASHAPPDEPKNIMVPGRRTCCY